MQKNQNSLRQTASVNCTYGTQLRRVWCGHKMVAQRQFVGKAYPFLRKRAHILCRNGVDQPCSCDCGFVTLGRRKSDCKVFRA